MLKLFNEGIWWIKTQNTTENIYWAKHKYITSVFNQYKGKMKVEMCACCTINHYKKSNGIKWNIL